MKLEIFALLMSLGAVMLSSCSLGIILGSDQVMQQAHERGYAVECTGKEGYFWECEGGTK